MRVKFNDHIDLCTRVSKGSTLLIITTLDCIYTVHMRTAENAETAYNNLLINGYCDVSMFEYSN